MPVRSGVQGAADSCSPFGNGPIPDKYKLMPIPQRAIDLNPLLKGQQNPGW